LKHFKHDIAGLNIIPSGEGSFDIFLDEKLLFSKKETGRFPEDMEVEQTVRAHLKSLQLKD